MLRVLNIIAVAALILLIHSCKKENGEPSEIGYTYQPVTVGNYLTYNVDSIVYDDFDNDTDHYRFRLKEVVESIFNDNEGRPTMRLERYIKNFDSLVGYDSLPWILRDVWTANLTTTTYEKVEENTRYLKLSFPVREGKTWDGNAFNISNEQTYTYTQADQPFTLGSLSFDSTLTVLQLENLNLVDDQYFEEKYAKNVGLIYKKGLSLYSGTITPGVPVKDRIEKGYDYTMQLIDYGSE